MSFSAGQFALLGLMALALTGLLTWPVRVLAIRIGAMDEPNLERKTQKEPVPYLGGLSIAIAGTALTYAGVIASDFTTTNPWQVMFLPASSWVPWVFRRSARPASAPRLRFKRCRSHRCNHVS